MTDLPVEDQKIIQSVCSNLLDGTLDPLTATKRLIPLLRLNKQLAPGETVILEKFFAEFEHIPVPSDWKTNPSVPPFLRAKFEGLCEFYSEQISLACGVIMSACIN